MTFVKIQKNKAYCSRMQTKYRRRRQGKTDYQARKWLIRQDRNKYDSKKYRLCVRRTGARIICQVIYAAIGGDKVMTQADSHELRAHGLTAGLTNYASAYATGLLCARRLLNLKKMDTMYKGAEKVDGKYFSVDEDMGDRRPFKAHLDIGLVRATTGNRAFGCMKGAADGGLYVPHNEKRFPGFRVVKAEVQTNKRGKKADEQEKSTTNFDAAEHHKHIMGAHVQGYYELLKKEDAAKFKKQFSRWSKCLADSKCATIPALYEKVHKAIRANPVHKKKAANTKAVRKEVAKAPNQVMQNSKGKKWLRQRKISTEAKKVRINDMLSKLKAVLGN